MLRLLYLHSAQKMAPTEKLCSLFFIPSLHHRAHHWPWTDSEKDCHLLKTPHHFPTKLNLPLHLPPSYPTSWILLASSQRWSMRHTQLKEAFFSNKSPRFSALQFSLLPRIVQYFLKNRKIWENLEVSKNHAALHTNSSSQ